VQADSVTRRPTRFRLPPPPDEQPSCPEVKTCDPPKPATRPGVVPVMCRPARIAPPPAPVAEMTPATPVKRRPAVRMSPPKLEPTFDAIPGLPDPNTGELVPFAPRPAPRASGLSQADIEAITRGATKEIAVEMLAKLRSLGVRIDRAGKRCRNWGLWTTEWAILGLSETSPVAYGSTTDPMGTSAWWSRNRPFEEERCRPPF